MTSQVKDVDIIFRAEFYPSTDVAYAQKPMKNFLDQEYTDFISKRRIGVKLAGEIGFVDNSKKIKVGEKVSLEIDECEEGYESGFIDYNKYRQTWRAYSAVLPETLKEIITTCSVSKPLLVSIYTKEIKYRKASIISFRIDTDPEGNHLMMEYADENNEGVPKLI